MAVYFIAIFLTKLSKLETNERWQNMNWPSSLFEMLLYLLWQKIDQAFARNLHFNKVLLKMKTFKVQRNSKLQSTECLSSRSCPVFSMFLDGGWEVWWSETLPTRCGQRPNIKTSLKELANISIRKTCWFSTHPTNMHTNTPAPVGLVTHWVSLTKCAYLQYGTYHTGLKLIVYLIFFLIRISSPWGQKLYCCSLCTFWSTWHSS